MFQPIRSGFMPRIAVLIALIGGTLAAGTVDAPAQSRLAWIFDDPNPRPPADIPGEIFPSQPPPVHYPGPAPLPAPAPAPPPPAAIQTQPLAPLPGASVAPGNAPSAVTPGGALQPAGLPPGSPGAPQQPAEGSPQLEDTVVTEVPTQKIDNARAVFSGLDKITGRIISFDAAIGETVQFGALRVTTRACYTRPPTEATNTDAFVEVEEVTLQGEVKRIFSGWMFAASPGLHGVEHPIYDVWLTDCSSPLATKVAQPATPPTPEVAPTPPPRTRTRQGAARQQNAPLPPPVPPAPAAQN
jgi:hypothetical protein